MAQIAPAVLMVDYGALAEEIARLASELERLHFDVMDGHFVPAISYGPDLIHALRKRTGVPFDVHLMIQYPERYIGEFAKAGSDTIAVHVEVCPHLHRTVQQIREAGVRAGAALNPSTPLEAVEHVLEEVDQVLLMSVNPGFGGQRFIPFIEKKITELRRRLTERQLPCEIVVDGGINEKNCRQVAAAGASILVAGSAVFQAPDPLEALKAMKRTVAGF